MRDGGIGFFDLSEALLNPIIRVAKETVPNNTTTTDVAGCAPGERAIAGGYGTADDLQSGVAVISNGPTSFVSGSESLGGIATAWRSPDPQHHGLRARPDFVCDLRSPLATPAPSGGHHSAPLGAGEVISLASLRRRGGRHQRRARRAVASDLVH